MINTSCVIHNIVETQKTTDNAEIFENSIDFLYEYLKGNFDIKLIIHNDYEEPIYCRETICEDVVSYIDKTSIDCSVVEIRASQKVIIEFLEIKISNDAVSFIEKYFINNYANNYLNINFVFTNSKIIMVLENTKRLSNGKKGLLKALITFLVTLYSLFDLNSYILTNKLDEKVIKFKNNNITYQELKKALYKEYESIREDHTPLEFALALETFLHQNVFISRVFDYTRELFLLYNIDAIEGVNGFHSYFITILTSPQLNYLTKKIQSKIKTIIEIYNVVNNDFDDCILKIYIEDGETVLNKVKENVKLLTELFDFKVFGIR